MKNIPCERLFSAQLPPEVQLKRMRRILQEELTDLQREAIVGVYFQNRSLSAIARERGVNRSTVLRTLRRGENKLRKFMKY